MRLPARTVPALTALASTLVLSACGSQPPAAAPSPAPETTTAPTTTPPPSPAPAVTTAAGRAGAPRECVSSDLEFAITPSRTMGTDRSADVVVTNVHAGGPCGIVGYGGMALMDAGGATLPTAVSRLRVPAQNLVPHPITLAPGRSAYMHIEWTDLTVTGGSATGCVRSTSATVTPPDDVPSVVVPFAATVCDGGKLTAYPFRSR